MKIYYIILGFFVLMSCTSQFDKYDLPSQNLQDTIIKAAILKSTFNPNNKENPSPIDFAEYKINRDIQKNYPEPSSLHVSENKGEFSINYLFTPRFKINGENIFLPQDSSYISYQIKEVKPYRLSNSLMNDVLFIDDDIVNENLDHQRKVEVTDSSFRYAYINIYSPVLNLRGDIAIVRMMKIRLAEKYTDVHGLYVILKKEGPNWSLFTEVQWIN